MDYNIRMKELREEKNLMQKDMAKILDLSPFTYSHYETKDTIISLTQLIKVTDYFDVSLDYILQFSNKRNYSKRKNGLYQNALCTRLKESRKESKLTQTNLAKILNTTQSVIANFEKGTTLIALPFLYTICKKYNISADYLLGRIDEPKYLK